MFALFQRAIIVRYRPSVAVIACGWLSWPTSSIFCFLKRFHSLVVLATSTDYATLPCIILLHLLEILQDMDLVTQLVVTFSDYLSLKRTLNSFTFVLYKRDITTAAFIYFFDGHYYLHMKFSTSASCYTLDYRCLFLH